MIKLMRNEKGITITTLVITVLLLVIITSIISMNARDSLQLTKLTKLENDIKALNDRVAAYYVEKGELPVMKDAGFTYNKEALRKSLNDMSTNDGDDYYTIDLSKIDNITLNYGNNYNKSTTDRYIINEKTHVIYYLEGVYFDGDLYHTIGANPPIV